MGACSSPNTLRCPTGNAGCGGLWLQSPSGHPHPSKDTHWQKQTAHMRGLTGTDEPHAPPAHTADALGPEKGYCSAECQRRFPALHQPPAALQRSLPGLPGGQGDPQPLCLCCRGADKPKATLAVWPCYSWLPAPGQARRGRGLAAQPDAEGRLFPTNPEFLQSPSEPWGRPSRAALHPPTPAPQPQFAPTALATGYRATRSGTTRSNTTEPPGHKPPGKVPPNHRVRYPQVGYCWVRYHEVIGLGTTMPGTSRSGTTRLAPTRLRAG